MGVNRWPGVPSPIWGGAELRAEALVETRGSWGLLRVSIGPHLWGHKWVWEDTGQMQRYRRTVDRSKSKAGLCALAWEQPLERSILCPPLGGITLLVAITVGVPEVIQGHHHLVWASVLVQLHHAGHH